MTKYVLTHDMMMEERKTEVEGEIQFPDSAKLVDTARGLASTGSDFVAPAPPAPQRKRFSAAHAAAAAGKQLVELVHLPLDSVSAVTRNETGWQVVVNLVELSRIPHSIDVISSYTVSISEDGELESYRRIARYTRDQLGEDA